MFSIQVAQEAGTIHPIRREGLDDVRLYDTYRRIFSALDLPINVQPVIIGVTSAVGGEGRTTVALGLAQTLAVDLDVPISLVEMDLDRPSLARRLDVALVPGLSEALRGEYRLKEVGRVISEKLSVITTGAAGPDSARLLHRVKAHDPLRSPHGLEGVVILDLPPLLDRGYSALAAGVADAVVLVVRSGVTSADIVREAIGRLEKPPQGIILNDAPRPSRFARRFLPGRRV